MDRNLGEIVAANGGVFSRAQAIDCGETDRTLSIGVRDGALVRLRRGFYTAADRYAACDQSGKHLLHARAAIAGQRGKVALTGSSAAALHGFALYDTRLEHVHLVRLDSGATRTEAGVVHHGTRQDITGDLNIYDGILAVTPARAVWEVACRSSLEGGVVTADSALHQLADLGDALERLQQRFAVYPGSVKGRMALRIADGRSESPGESITRVQCFRFGVPMPDLQVRVYSADGRLVGIADFGWEEHRHLGEFDGRVKYERLLRAGESASDCVIREKQREDDIRATSYGMSRFTWSDVMRGRAPQTMRELCQALEQSRRLYGGNRTVIAS